MQAVTSQTESCQHDTKAMISAYMYIKPPHIRELRPSAITSRTRATSFVSIFVSITRNVR